MDVHYCDQIDVNLWSVCFGGLSITGALQTTPTAAMEGVMPAAIKTLRIQEVATMIRLRSVSINCRRTFGWSLNVRFPFRRSKVLKSLPNYRFLLGLNWLTSLDISCRFTKGILWDFYQVEVLQVIKQSLIFAHVNCFKNYIFHPML